MYDCRKLKKKIVGCYEPLVITFVLLYSFSFIVYISLCSSSRIVIVWVKTENADTACSAVERTDAVSPELATEPYAEHQHSHCCFILFDQVY